MSSIITPIIHAFAYGRSGDNVPPSPISSDNVANQVTGFPINQMLPPSNPSYQAVKEQELNGVFNFYTNYIYQSGQGAQYTYDATLSSAIGGYPLGAVLWSASKVAYVVSLIANNTNNFVTTPGFIDGAKWGLTTSDNPLPDIQDSMGLIKLITPQGLQPINLEVTGSSNFGTLLANAVTEIRSNHSWGSNSITNNESSSSLNVVLSNGISARCTVQSSSGLGTTASLFAFLGIFESNSTAFNTGISMTYGNRPVLQGNYLTFASAPQSILTFGDIPDIIDNIPAGAVTIGGRLLGGAVQQLIACDTTGGASGIRSTVVSAPQTSYLRTTNVVDGSYSTVSADWNSIKLQAVLGIFNNVGGTIRAVFQGSDGRAQLIGNTSIGEPNNSILINGDFLFGNSTNGFVKFPTNQGVQITIQWGTGVYNGSDGATGTLAGLPIAFTTAMLQAVSSDSGGAVLTTSIAQGTTLSNVRIWARDVGNVGAPYTTTTVRFIVIGY